MRSPRANGVVTGRGLAKMYGVLANNGRIDGKKYLSEELASGLTGEQRRKWPDANMVVPMPFHLGYHESPVPGLLRGFGHVGLGGTLGWADPEAGSSFGFIHNRLLTPLLFDMGSFAGLARPLRNAIEAARHQGPLEVPQLGASLSQTRSATRGRRREGGVGEPLAATADSRPTLRLEPPCRIQHKNRALVGSCHRNMPGRRERTCQWFSGRKAD